MLVRTKAQVKNDELEERNAARKVRKISIKNLNLPNTLQVRTAYPYYHMHRPSNQETTEYTKKYKEQNKDRYPIYLSKHELGLIKHLVEYRLNMTDMYYTTELDMKLLKHQLSK
ncbi:MAG: hypothetical protein WBQ25_24440 [Nitrososphaeraceae archaeon]